MTDNIPVPTSNSNEIIEIKLFDLSGRFISMLYSGFYRGKDKLSVDLSGLRPGSYVVNVMIEGKFCAFKYIM